MRLFKTVPLFLALALRGLAAEDTPAAPSPLSVQLEWGAGEEALISRYANFTAQSEPFKKEPALAKTSVQRGHLTFGSPDKNKLACIYDATNGKLYLDLNGNGDLTDDVVFTAAGKSNEVARTSRLFKNIRVPVQTPSGRRTFVVDLDFYSYGGNQVSYVSTQVRSAWQGQLSWKGQDWQVMVVDDVMDSVGEGFGPSLVLRPWAERKQPVKLAGGTADAMRFPSRLFWQNQAWRVTRQNEAAASGPEKCRLQFTPEQPKLGQITISGAFLHRAILEDKKGYTLFLDTFGQAAKVPEGIYKISAIWIQNEKARAANLGQRDLSIRADTPVKLAAGGPLTNSVTISRRGKYLSLGHQLLGADGSPYRMYDSDTSTPPEFAVYQGDKKVASGKFNFG